MFIKLFVRLFPLRLSILLTVLTLFGSLQAYAIKRNACIDLYRRFNVNKSETNGFLLSRVKSKDNLYENTKMYRPISYLAQKMGLKYNRVEEQIIPLGFDFYSNSAYEVAVIRRFFSDNFAVDVTGIEWRSGLSQEFINLINQSSILPKMKDDQGRIIIRAEDIKIDYELPPEKRNHSFSNYARSIEGGFDSTQRAELDRIHQQILIQGRSQFHDLINSYVQFSHLHYQRRGWTPEMLARLEEKALEYVRKSTYITVRELDSKTGEPGAIVGNLRLISDAYKKEVTKYKTGIPRARIEIEPYSSITRSRSTPSTARSAYDWQDWVSKQSKDLSEPKILDHDWRSEDIQEHYVWSNDKSYKYTSPLMMEDILNIQLPRPAMLRYKYIDTFSGEGEIIEPGVFAIDKKFNAQAFTEILTHLLLFVADPNYNKDFNINSRAFYTYNDYPQLYSSLGFQKVGNPYKSEFNEKTKKIHQWWILRALPKDILAALEKITTLRKNSDLENLEIIRRQILSAEEPQK